MKNVVLFFLVWLPLIAFTQTKAAYKIGEPYKYVEAPTQYKFQNEEQSQTLTIKIHNGYIYFQKFDNKTLSEIKREKVKMYDEIQGYSAITGISKLGEKIFCFYFYWNAKEKKWIIKCREISFRSCKFTGKEKVVFKTDKMMASYWSFPYVLSKDKSKIMFYWRHFPTKFKDKVNYDVFSFCVFDTELKELNTASINMPYTEKKMDNEQFILHSNGSPYLLSRVFNDDTRDTKKKSGKTVIANYHYEVFQVDLSSKSILKTDISLGNTLITDLYISEGEENTILASGFYTNKSNENLRILGIQVSKASVDGLCLFTIDDIGEVLNETKFEIPNEIVNQYEKTAKKKDNDPELSNLKMRNIISQEKDGSIILIAEQIYQFSSASGSFDNNGHLVSGSDENYRFDDIVICKLSSENKILWIKKLPKRQAGKNSAGDLSFSYQNLNNNHYLIFLDNVKNINLSLNQRPAIHASEQWGYLTYYKVLDTSGTVSKQSLFTTKGIPVKGRKLPYLLYFFRPNEVIKTSENTFMVEFYKKFKEDVMIQVEVK